MIMFKNIDTFPVLNHTCYDRCFATIDTVFVETQKKGVNRRTYIRYKTWANFYHSDVFSIVGNELLIRKRDTATDADFDETSEINEGVWTSFWCNFL